MTPLTDAEPGDIAVVALKITARDSAGYYVHAEQDHLSQSYVPFSQIRSIEKAPKPLRVGDDVVMISGRPAGTAKIVGVHDKYAWTLGFYKDEPVTLPLTELVRVSRV